jgi:hypothetical protein
LSSSPATNSPRKAQASGLGSAPAILICLSLFACSSTPPTNPSFPVSIATANHILDQSTARPQPLNRPLLIVGGFMDPGIAPLFLQHQFKNFTSDSQIISVSLGDCFTFDDCRMKIIRAADASFPTTDLSKTTEVDVIGYSLGGVATRFAATEEMDHHKPPRRLRIARLFTISSPHRGARAAKFPLQLLALQEALLPNSPFIEELNNRANLNHSYPIYPYVRLDDEIIGVENAAPPGQIAWWVPTPQFSNPHLNAFSDPRIIADILLRLHSQTPLSTDPASPYPNPPERGVTPSAR